MNKNTIMNHIRHYTDKKFCRIIFGYNINNGDLDCKTLLLSYPELVEYLYNRTNENEEVIIDTLYSVEIDDEITILLEKD